MNLLFADAHFPFLVSYVQKEGSRDACNGDQEEGEHAKPHVRMRLGLDGVCTHMARGGTVRAKPFRVGCSDAEFVNGRIIVVNRLANNSPAGFLRGQAALGYFPFCGAVRPKLAARMDKAIRR